MKAKISEIETDTPIIVLLVSGVELRGVVGETDDFPNSLTLETKGRGVWSIRVDQIAAWSYDGERM